MVIGAELGESSDGNVSYCWTWEVLMFVIDLVFRSQGKFMNRKKVTLNLT